MTNVTIALPEEVLAALHRSSRELESEIRLAAAIDWYRRKLLSQGRAAEIAGIPRADFIDELATRKIEVVQIGPEDLDREMGDA